MRCGSAKGNAGVATQREQIWVASLEYLGLTKRWR